MNKTATPTNWHQLPAAEAVQLLEVDLKTGLASEEVKRRRLNSA